MIRGICLARKFVGIQCVDRLKTRHLKAAGESTRPAEQINKWKLLIGFRCGTRTRLFQNNALRPPARAGCGGPEKSNSNRIAQVCPEQAANTRPNLSTEYQSYPQDFQNVEPVARCPIL